MAEDKVKCCYDATSQEVLEEMVNSAPAQQDALTLQIDQVSQQKEKIDEQIVVLEGCVEDCSANMLEGLLHELAREQQIGSITPRGIWKDQTSYTGTGNRDVVIAPIGTGSWGAARCISSHTSSPETKPFVGADWTTVWSNYTSSITVHLDYVVTLGPTFNQKTYGTVLTDWKITDTTGTTNYYVYHGGPWYGTWPEVDGHIDDVVNDWNEANEMVTAPLGEEGFFGLKALSSALDKAKTGLTNTRAKITNMVPILSKFI